MRIVEHVWRTDVAAILETMMIHQRTFTQEQADFAGLTLAQYVALAILEYLERENGENLDVVRFDPN